MFPLGMSSKRTIDVVGLLNCTDGDDTLSATLKKSNASQVHAIQLRSHKNCHQGTVMTTTSVELLTLIRTGPTEEERGS